MVFQIVIRPSQQLNVRRRRRRSYSRTSQKATARVQLTDVACNADDPAMMPIAPDKTRSNDRSSISDLLKETCRLAFLPLELRLHILSYALPIASTVGAISACCNEEYLLDLDIQRQSLMSFECFRPAQRSIVRLSEANPILFLWERYHPDSTREDTATDTAGMCRCVRCASPRTRGQHILRSHEIRDIPAIAVSSEQFLNPAINGMLARSCPLARYIANCTDRPSPLPLPCCPDELFRTCKRAE